MWRRLDKRLDLLWKSPRACFALTVFVETSAHVACCKWHTTLTTALPSGQALPSALPPARRRDGVLAPTRGGARDSATATWRTCCAQLRRSTPAGWPFAVSRAPIPLSGMGKMEERTTATVTVRDDLSHGKDGSYFEPFARPAPPYSISSSARARIDAGMAMPSAFAAVMLITSSNVVGCTTGRSAGLAPLSMRPT